jgi:hypothetical protein
MFIVALNSLEETFSNKEIWPFNQCFIFGQLSL